MVLTITKPQPILERVRMLDHPTPFFFTQKTLLRQNYQLYTSLFDKAEVYYALKANSDPKILNYIDQLGCGFEAASAFEIEQLLNLGVDPMKIIYGTSIKPAEHIRHSYRAGVKRFAADSREELKKIADNAPGAKIFIRTIVDDAGSVFMMAERFGSPVGEVLDLFLYAHSLGLKTYGVSFYVGSQAAHADMWARGIRTVAPVIEQLWRQGITLEVINIGGGFPVHYDNHQDAPELHEIVARIHDEIHLLPYIPTIIMEPGRGLVATSTVLVAEVIARNDRAGKPWLCLDAGIYNALYEAMIHQGATRYPTHMLNPPTEPVDTQLFTLAGPTGDSLDVIARDVELPSYVGVGDRLVFEHAGAYTIAMANPFNGFPKPRLYLG